MGVWYRAKNRSVEVGGGAIGELARGSGWEKVERRDSEIWGLLNKQLIWTWLEKSVEEIGI
jgi:hypothetical protein